VSVCFPVPVGGLVAATVSTGAYSFAAIGAVSACLARRQAAESRHDKLHVLLLFLFITIFVRQIVSKFTRLIFAKFSGLVELWL